MPVYYLYFLDDSNHVFAREDFKAPDDATAVHVGAVIAEACSDAHSGYAIWQATRQLYSTDEDSRGFARGLSATALPADAQEIVLEREHMLLSSHWSIATSRKLLAATADLEQLQPRKVG
jgi:hypothetical protein